MSIKSTFKKGIYTSLIAVASLLLTTEAKGQEFLPPKGNINMFQSLDNTINAQEYNKLKTRAQRDSIIEVRLQEDFTNTIYLRAQPTSWSCNESTLQLIVNSHNWGKEDTYYSDHILYNGYDGEDLESIYTNSGTLKDMGKLGLPMYQLSLYDPVTLPDGHAMNAILTGDDATKFENWNIIEPQNDQINITPGDKRSPFPENCEHVQIYYSYLFKNDKHEKNYYNWKMLEFEVTNGKATLTYNINEDNTTIIPWASPEPLNKYIKLITLRKDIDTGIFNKPTLEQITKIYPNPTRDYINIEIPEQQKNINTQIYTIDGKLLNENTIENHEQINVSNLKEGIYIIKATTNNHTYTGKFIKK
jgi:hypothetical protein